VLNGEIPCVKFRTKVLIDRRDLDDWIEANKETGVFGCLGRHIKNTADYASF